MAGPDSMKKNLKIAIVNSSSFALHFKEHLSELQSFADVKRVDFGKNPTAEEMLAELKDVQGIIASVTPRFPEEVLSKLPELVLLSRHGIGCDNVDLQAATKAGILVSKVAGIVEQDAVAEQAVALMLSVGRAIPQGFLAVRESRWADRGRYLGIELSQQRIGLIGLGNIGSRVAQILKQGFRSEVLAYDPALSAEEISARFAKPVSLEELLKTSDIVSFHCPLTAESRRMLSRERFQLLKSGAILINTCRGELLDEDALFEALKTGALRAYGTDVVEGEPIDGTHRLLSLENVLVVPHLGGYTLQSLRGMGETMVKDMQRVFLQGDLPGVLANPEVLEGEYRKCH